MTNKNTNNKGKNFLGKKLSYTLAVVFSAASIVSILAIILFNLFYNNKIYPKASVLGIDISGLTPAEAETKLRQNLSDPTSIKLVFQDQHYEISTKDIGFNYNYEEVVQTAFNSCRFGQGLTFLNLLNSSCLFSGERKHQLTYQLNKDLLQQKLVSIADEIGSAPINPQVFYRQGDITVDKGKEGKSVDIAKLADEITDNLSQGKNIVITIKEININPTIDDTEANNLTTRAQKIKGKSIKFYTDETEFLLSDSKIINLLAPYGNNYQNKINDLSTDISNSLSREPQNSVFVYRNDKVEEFVPSLKGIKVNANDIAEILSLNLKSFENSSDTNIALRVQANYTEPEITTDKVNNLGIKELIGKGSSRFKGSILSRIHNIKLASSKFNGVLVKPNEILSFNDTLGDVSAYTGYKQAYIIQDGKTVLGDGGGVCQVSTTFFRAALNAGLPIKERHAHSYRVGYYEQDSPPGLDATVFSPSTDLKIVNDTPSYLLIQTIFNEKENLLVFEIYGTKDGRVSTVSKPIITGTTPPPDDLYIDDPTLPTGTIKQIDYKAWGARVNFNYKVERNGEVLIDRIFYSNYQAWQAKFLRGVKTN